MQDVKVFVAERNDGLEEKIVANRTVAFYSRCVELINQDDSEIKKAQIAAKRILGSGRDTFDLYPVNTIFVTTGWNGNDDIFDCRETWAARHSPEDKPFNIDHDPRRIIGHITGVVGIDTDGSVIENDVVCNDLPNKFHLLTSGVIYKHVSSRDENLREETAEIIAEIESKKRYVSMEVLFNGFNYGIKLADGSHKIIPRSENTAFLTKYLRAYGGKGIYQGQKIGRVMKDMTFSGKGLVEDPANPESVFIFDDITAFAGKLASEEEIELIVGTKNCNDEVDVMADISEYKDKIGVLERKLAEANQRLCEMDEQAVQAKLDAKDAEVKSRDEQIDALKAENDKITASYNAAEEARKEAEEATAKAQDELSKDTKELEAMKAENKKVERVATLVDKSIEKSDAERIVGKFIDLDDEKFSEIVAMQEQLVEAKKIQSGTETEVTEEDQEETDEATAESEEQALDESTEDEGDPDLASASENKDEEKEQAQAALSKYCSEWLGKRRKRVRK